MTDTPKTAREAAIKRREKIRQLPKGPTKEAAKGAHRAISSLNHVKEQYEHAKAEYEKARAVHSDDDQQ